MSPRTLPLPDALATEALGRELGAALRGGEVLFLEGELGAGKTTLTRGLLAGLGGDPDEAASPTYTYLHTYKSGRLILHHADLYRVRGSIDDLGLDECIGEGRILAVEWPEQLALQDVRPMRIRLRHEGAHGETRLAEWS
jgi:tRNA threonylcarbamoyladenosine biosynthesis protein TsaE